MLFVIKPLILLYLSSLPALADACCSECAQGHACASQKLSIVSDRYPQLLVFVSFSMPMDALKVLGAQVTRVGGALVFRGLTEGSFKKTAAKFKDLKHPALIDPALFEAYKVGRVPTFVLRQKTTDQAETRVTHDSISGNVTLMYALEQFSSQGDTADIAKTFFQKIKRSS